MFEEARALLDNHQPEAALELLSKYAETHHDDVLFLQILGETLLEVNELDQAYEILVKSVQLDPEANQGVEKFMYLGQIVGGEQGIQYLDIALRKLDSLPKEEKIIKKLNEGIFAKIEIWMTDLCMEEQAEAQCDELINYSISLDDKNPETFSLLASIRISQQRNDDAIKAIEQSWLYFKTIDLNLGVIDIQPLITLAKYAIELELYDISLEILDVLNDLNDSILEVSYLTVTSLLFRYKHQHNIPRDQDLQPNEIDDEVKHEIRSALTNGFKILQTQEDLDDEVASVMNELIKDFGGPIMSELVPEKISQEDINEVDNIDSDTEN